jgi:hypothetical protein
MKHKILIFLLALSCNLFAQGPVNQEKVPGIPIVHSPKSSGKYLGSPSIIILPNGEYLMSFDFFGPGCTSDIVQVYKSSDKGKTWNYLTELQDTFWAGLFLVKNDVYLLGVRGSDRNLSIRKSTDFGKTWSAHSILREGRFHGSTTPVIFHNGRVYKGYDHLGIEDKKKKWMADNKSFIMSAPEQSDLMDPKSWTYSNEIVKPAAIDGTGWLETNVVLGKNGNIVGLTRLANESGYNAGYYSLKSSAEIDESTIGRIPFIGGATKFNVMWDAKTKRYWALTNYPAEKLRAPKMRAGGMRSVLSLISSKDLKSWKTNAILLASENVKYHGFQYVDWQFEGKDIIFISRTGFTDAFGEADNAHNSNYMTFHRIKNYSKAKTPKEFKYLIN